MLKPIKLNLRITKAIPHARYFLPALVWAGAVLYLSVIPAKQMPQWDWNLADKAEHTGAYALLAGLTAWGFRLFELMPLSRQANLFIWCGGAGYGFLMEVFQGLFCPTRTFDLWDVLANATGCTLGLVAWWMMANIFRR